MADGAGIAALILVILVIIFLVLALIFFFVNNPGEFGVTGFTGTGNDTINNLGNKLILYQPSGAVSGTPVITLGASSNNSTGKQFIIRNNSNLNTASNTLQIASGGTTISNIPSGNTRISVPAGSSAWFVFNRQNTATLIGVVSSSFAT